MNESQVTVISHPSAPSGCRRPSWWVRACSCVRGVCWQWWDAAVTLTPPSSLPYSTLSQVCPSSSSSSSYTLILFQNHYTSYFSFFSKFVITPTIPPLPPPQNISALPPPTKSYASSPTATIHLFHHQPSKHMHDNISVYYFSWFQASINPSLTHAGPPHTLYCKEVSIPHAVVY